MSLRRFLLVASLAIPAIIAGCQGQSSAGSSTVEPPPSIELRDAGGTISARLIPGHPCRAMVDGIELMIGTQPLVAQLGDVRWTGDEATNGLVLRRNDEVMARVFPADQASEIGLYSAEGVAMFRASISGTKADLISGAGTTVGSVHTLPQGGIAIDDRVITGTDDLLLAALLAAPEAGPEVRGLAACHRLSLSPKAL